MVAIDLLSLFQRRERAERINIGCKISPLQKSSYLISLLTWNSQTDFFTKNVKLGLSELAQPLPKDVTLKKIGKEMENFEKRTIPPAASILHAYPLGSCETDTQSFICALSSMRGLIKPLKPY